MDPHDIIGPNIAPNERWQGPTAAVTWGPHFEHVRIYGIDNRRHIVEWKQGSGESWQKPVVIEDQIEVAVGGSVTAMLSEDKERIVLFFEGADNRAYFKAGNKEGQWEKPGVLP